MSSPRPPPRLECFLALFPVLVGALEAPEAFWLGGPLGGPPGGFLGGGCPPVPGNNGRDIVAAGFVGAGVVAAAGVVVVGVREKVEIPAEIQLSLYSRSAAIKRVGSYPRARLSSRHVTAVAVYPRQLAGVLNTHELEVPIQCLELFAVLMRLPCRVSEAPTDLEFQFTLAVSTMAKDFIDEPFGVVWCAEIVWFGVRTIRK